METYPYPTPEGIIDLVRKSEFDRLKWDLEEQKAKYTDDVAELNERLKKQHADMREAIEDVNNILLSIQLNDIFEETMRNHATYALTKLQPFIKP